MNKRFDILKCAVCGNVVEFVDAKMGELVCCGQKMNVVVADSVDAATEKHVPVIVKTDEGYLVSVGEVEHPSLPEHFILYIELVADGVHYKKYLNPGEKPVYEFKIGQAENVYALEYCNLHGLWQGE